MFITQPMYLEMFPACPSHKWTSLKLELCFL